MARHPYPIHSIRYYQPVTEAALREAARQGGTWRGALTAVLPYGPLVANHCLCSAGLQPQAAADGESDAVREVLTAVRGFERFLAAAEHTPVKGYILTKPAKGQWGLLVLVCVLGVCSSAQRMASLVCWMVNCPAHGIASACVCLTQCVSLCVAMACLHTIPPQVPQRMLRSFLTASSPCCSSNTRGGRCRNSRRSMQHWLSFLARCVEMGILGGLAAASVVASVYNNQC